MLALRLQRRGRKKLPMYRLIAQEHSVQPTSGKVVAYLGNYNPHTKEVNIEKDEIEKFLSNGAQPSNRVAILLKNAGVKLPKWVVIKEKADTKPEPAAEETKVKETEDTTNEEPGTDEKETKDKPEEKTEKPAAKEKESKAEEKAEEK